MTLEIEIREEEKSKKKTTMLIYPDDTLSGLHRGGEVFTFENPIQNVDMK